MKPTSSLLCLFAISLYLTSVTGFTGKALNILYIRTSPSTRSSVIGLFNTDVQFDIECQLNGETASGLAGTTNIWYYIPAKRGYVSGAFVSTGGGSYPKCAYSCGGSGVPGLASSENNCSGGLRNPRTCTEAVAWAKAHLTNSSYVESRRLHDNFVGLAYGHSGSSFETALMRWQATPERFKHYDRNPPAGALCFFKASAAGHVTLCTGNGHLISTNWNGLGTVGETTITTMESKWGPYLGWTSPYFQNA